MIACETRNRSFRYVMAALLALFSFTSYTIEKAVSQNVCDRVAIDSVEGDVGIWRDKIAGISWSRGITGTIDYVRIVPPAGPANVAKVRRMWLWWGSHPIINAVCKNGPDIGQRPAINCAQSVPGTQLTLDITFEPDAGRDTELRTSELVKYVTGDVLCKLE